MNENKAVAIVNEWLKSLSFNVGDAKVMSGSEWIDRGEKYGKGSLAVLLVDGSPLYAAFNYGEPSWRIHDSFMELLDSHGLWFEPMYGWALAVYAQ